MLIQFLSDVHLEFGPVEVIPTDADLIVAAGDIGIGGQGIEWLKSLGKPVVYVAGNHEFYGLEYAETLAMLREAAVGSNVHFLEREAWCPNGSVRFLGCTLWSNLGGEDNAQMDELVHSVNDFRRIRYGSKALAPESYIHLHRISRDWLLRELDKPFAGKTVVVTHHAPTPWSWRESPGHVKRYAYCNDLKEVLHTFDIAAWFHGHTHAVSDYRCSGARILCNPRGYFPQRLVDEFDPARCVEL